MSTPSDRLAPRPITSPDVAAMLRRHYLPEGRIPGGFFATEVGSPCGTRRADALWLPTTIAGGSELVGHEIKVSRSDLIVELADPAKADPWARFCGRWWIVVSDPRFVDGLAIPDAWGVMAPPSGRRTRTMTVLKPAPRLNPVNPAPGLRRLIAWQMANYGERTLAAEARTERLDQRVEELQRELDERPVIEKGMHASPAVQKLNRILFAVDKRLREHTWNLVDVHDDLIVEAIVDAALTRHSAKTARQAMERLMAEVERDLEPLRYAREMAAVALKAGLAGLDEATTGTIVQRTLLEAADD